MLVRIFFSFSNNSDEKDDIAEVHMCTELKKKIFTLLKKYSIDFDYFFYLEGKEDDEKKFRNGDHYDSCDFANYFIILYMGGPYLSSTICREEYYRFQKNPTYPKSPHVVFRDEFDRNDLEDLTNLEYLDESEWKKFEGIEPYDNKEIFPSGFHLTTSNLISGRKYLTEKDMEEDKLNKYARQISNELKNFHSDILKKLEEQTLVGGFKAISDDEKNDLFKILKEHNKEIFLSPFFIQLKPFMPEISKRIMCSTKRNRLIEGKCIEKAKEIIWFINTDITNNDIYASLVRIEKKLSIEKETTVTVVSNESLDKVIPDKKKLPHCKFLTKEDLSEKQNGLLNKITQCIKLQPNK